MLARRALLIALVVIGAGAPVSLTAQSIKDIAQDSTEMHERLVKRQRQGAGIRLGSWQVQGIAPAAGSTTLPAFEGYWQKGLDKHVVLETSAGLWSRTQHTAGGSTGSYVIPMLTSIKLYPATVPGQVLEPFLMGGLGFTLGIDDQNGGQGGGVIGGSSGGGTMLIPGLGLKAGVGVEYHIGSAFGLVAQAGYQYVRFFQDVGGDRTYKGVQVFAGMTYRFQF